MSLRTLLTRSLVIRSAAPLALVLSLSPIACSSSDDGGGTTDDIDSGFTADTTPVLDTASEAALDTTVATDSFVTDVIVPGDSSKTDAADATDVDGTPSDVASDGDALADGAEVAKACIPGTIENQDCGKCGTRSRLCDSTKTWLDYGLCSDETGVCSPGESGSVACGRCGMRKQTCSATCTWTSEACTGEKACTAGSTETQTGTCLDATKSKKRTCSATCEWGDWSDCL